MRDPPIPMVLERRVAASLAESTHTIKFGFMIPTTHSVPSITSHPRFNYKEGTKIYTADLRSVWEPSCADGVIREQLVHVVFRQPGAGMGCKPENKGILEAHLDCCGAVVTGKSVMFVMFVIIIYLTCTVRASTYIYRVNVW